MTKSLDFFFFIGSTYTYLAVSRVDEVAAREGVPIRWRPFNVRALMIEQNNRPFVGKPVKLSYMWRDVERRANRYGIAFASIPPYPIDLNDLANRTAVVASLEDWCPEYVKAAYGTWILDCEDPGEEDSLTRLLLQLEKQPEKVIARANSKEIRERYEAETDVARQLGVFGSPTFVWDSEIFWGDDRLEDAIDWAKSHEERSDGAEPGE